MRSNINLSISPQLLHFSKIRDGTLRTILIVKFHHLVMVLVVILFASPVLLKMAKKKVHLFHLIQGDPFAASQQQGAHLLVVTKCGVDSTLSVHLHNFNTLAIHFWEELTLYLIIVQYIHLFS